jgi:protein translocase SEC61 complex gamma subunit
MDQNQQMQAQNFKPGAGTKIKSFFIQSKRVWHILRKPSNDEFKSIAKISALGILAIGVIGFIIADIIMIFH